MKTIKNFAIMICLLCLLVNTAKATKHTIQLPSASQEYCQSVGLDTFLILKPIFFTSTIWTVNGNPVWNGDTLVYASTIPGLYTITAISGGNTVSFNLSLYVSVPDHSQFQVTGSGSITNNDTIWMCGSAINVGSAADPAQCSSWNWSGPAGFTSSTAGGPVSISTPGIYILIRPNACGITKDSFQLVSQPTTIPVWSDTTFCNVPVALTLDPGPGWNYSWSTGSHSQVLNITSAGMYTLNYSNHCNFGSYTVNVYHNTYPVPDLLYLQSYIRCYGDTVTLDPSPGHTYTSYAWSTGAITPTIKVTGATTLYTVTVHEGVCSEYAYASIQFYQVPKTPQICVVTVDNTFTKNLIVWTADNEPVGPETMSYARPASYNVYKATGTNSWNLIGNVLATAEHTFEDVSSNPQQISALYKISMVDTCGSEGLKSYYHKTILLSATQGSNPGEIPLLWSPYTEESGTFLIDKYYIFRGDSPGNLVLHDSIPGYNTSYVDTGVYSQKYYQIGILKASCNSTAVLSKNGVKNTYTGSFSNITTSSVGINEYALNNINVDIYPNPTKDNLTIETNLNTQQRVEIINLIGQTVYINIINKKAIINTSAFANGVYILKLSSEKETVVRKFIKQ